MLEPLVDEMIILVLHSWMAPVLAFGPGARGNTRSSAGRLPLLNDCAVVIRDVS